MFNPPPLIDVALPSAQNAPRLARRALRELIGDQAPAAFTDDALLVTSELVSNATTVGGGCRLSAWYEDDGALRVEVHDHSEVIPSMLARRDPQQLDGRGLRIVDSIASRWGVEPDEAGKSVWFEMFVAL